MKQSLCFLLYPLLLMLLLGTESIAQSDKAKDFSSDRKKNASKKIESGVKKNNPDTLAEGYLQLGEGYYLSGEKKKSETFLKKAKTLFEQNGDADGIARSSRALAKVQEDLDKKKEAIINYEDAQANSFKSGDYSASVLNGNDGRRLLTPDSLPTQQALLQDNITNSLKLRDTNEIISGFARMGDVSFKSNDTRNALNAYQNAYKFSQHRPEQQMMFNQQITNIHLGQKDFTKAIEAKKEILNEPFVQQSSQLKAKEITELADIYLKKEEQDVAVNLLKESYALSVKNGHTLEARRNIEKLDSIYRSRSNTAMSLQLYKDFLEVLPEMIARDSSIMDRRLVAATEARVKELEEEQSLKDDLLRRQSIFNYWLMGFLVALFALVIIIFFMLRKLRVRSKKIALQSLRREMNPHFIFNSLNSVNHFIATNNEREANQYLSRFSTLMRRVMENSKDDFVLLSKEMELLQHYLELEKSRFPEKFDFSITIDEALEQEGQYFIPGMLIQPYLENAIWHGLRYREEKGMLKVVLNKVHHQVQVIIEDNGIGIEKSKSLKTTHQQTHKGRGIDNTIERIRILNELYKQQITCSVENKTAPASGVLVTMRLPLVKTNQA